MDINLKDAKQTILGSKDEPRVPISRSKDVYHNSGKTVEEELNGIINGAIWSFTGADSLGYRWGHGGCGVINASMVFGGYNDTGGLHETSMMFNGTTWSSISGGDIPTPRTCLAGCGNITAALAFGGENSSTSCVTEKFDGSSWSVSGNMNYARACLGGCGYIDAALACGGTDYTNTLNYVESFNGSEWSQVEYLITNPRMNLAETGSVNASLVFGGSTSSSYSDFDSMTSMEIFNGYGWSEGPSMINPRTELTGYGDTSSSLSAGGCNSTVTELFNGSSWGLTSHLNIGRRWHACGGNASTALAAGGLLQNMYSVLNSTEKYDYFFSWMKTINENSIPSTIVSDSDTIVS